MVILAVSVMRDDEFKEKLWGSCCRNKNDAVALVGVFLSRNGAPKGSAFPPEFSYSRVVG